MVDRSWIHKVLFGIGIILVISSFFIIEIKLTAAQTATGTPSPTMTYTTTATASPTITYTVTVTSSLLVTNTPTGEPYPGITPTPGDATVTSTGITPNLLTPIATGVILPEVQSSEPVTATQTLAPFPTITLVFPTSQVAATALPTPNPVQDQPGSIDRFILMAILIVMWAGLIGWFWIVQQRMG